MDFTITTFCNLNCKNCCSLMPYYKTPFHINLEQIKESLNIINENSRINTLYLVGGETLLHPAICTILKYITTLDFECINIYTNGTIIPKGFEDTLGSLDDRFTICITNYDDKSICINKLIEMCKKRNVQYEINEFGNIPGSKGGEEWVKWGSPSLKPIAKMDVNDIRCRCFQKVCCLGDKVYRCTRIAHLYQIGAIELDDNEWCYINELNDKYEEMCQTGFTKGCYHCFGGTLQAINIPKGS